MPRLSSLQELFYLDAGGREKEMDGAVNPMLAKGKHLPLSVFILLV